jgi:hypothetical protein
MLARSGYAVRLAPWKTQIGYGAVIALIVTIFFYERYAQAPHPSAA